VYGQVTRPNSSQERDKEVSDLFSTSLLRSLVLAAIVVIAFLASTFATYTTSSKNSDTSEDSSLEQDPEGSETQQALAETRETVLARVE
jgi:hypothetical protein